jgi:hypothetical protein
MMTETEAVVSPSEQTEKADKENVVKSTRRSKRGTKEEVAPIKHPTTTVVQDSVKSDICADIPIEHDAEIKAPPRRKRKRAGYAPMDAHAGSVAHEMGIDDETDTDDENEDEKGDITAPEAKGNKTKKADYPRRETCFLFTPELVCMNDF